MLTAQVKGYDAELAEAMVRKDIEYKVGDKVISPKGQLLTLTNVEAEEKADNERGTILSEGTVKSVNELLDQVGLFPIRSKRISGYRYRTSLPARLLHLLLF